MYRTIFRGVVVVLCVSSQVLAARRTAGNAKPTRLTSTSESGTVDEASAAAKRMLETALDAQLAGDLEGRNLYLHEALELDAQNAAAHWYTGHVQVRGRWMTIDEACNCLARDRRLDQYRQQRAGTEASPMAQMQLAAWCKEVGLMDAGRAHFFAASEQQPDLDGEEFGLVSYRGTLLTQEQARRQQRQDKQLQITVNQWRPRLLRLRKQWLSSESQARAEGLAELRTYRDPAAVPAIEAIFSDANLAESLLAVELIKEIRGQSAALAMVRRAILSRWPQVRQAAAAALKSRSLYSYAPSLLAALEPPVAARFDSIQQDGAPTYRLSLFREGAMSDYLVTQDLKFLNILNVRPGERLDPRFTTGTSASAVPWRLPRASTKVKGPATIGSGGTITTTFIIRPNGPSSIRTMRRSL